MNFRKWKNLLILLNNVPFVAYQSKKSLKEIRQPSIYFTVTTFLRLLRIIRFIPKDSTMKLNLLLIALRIKEYRQIGLNH